MQESRKTRRGKEKGKRKKKCLKIHSKSISIFRKKQQTLKKVQNFFQIKFIGMVLFILTDSLEIKLESIVKRLPKELAATILIQLNSIKLESNQDDEKDQVEDEDVEYKVIDHKILVEVSNWAKSKGIKEQSKLEV